MKRTNARILWISSEPLGEERKNALEEMFVVENIVNVDYAKEEVTFESTIKIAQQHNCNTIIFGNDVILQLVFEFSICLVNYNIMFEIKGKNGNFYQFKRIKNINLNIEYF